MRFPFILTILLLPMLAMLLTGCKEDPPATSSAKAAEAARIEREVARRVSAARLESSVRTKRLHTIRVVGFILLTGAAVAGLLWLRNRRSPEHPSPQYRIQGTQPPLWNDHYPPGNGRVIDFPSAPPNRNPDLNPDRLPNPPPQPITHETPPRT